MRPHVLDEVGRLGGGVAAAWVLALVALVAVVDRHVSGEMGLRTEKTRNQTRITPSKKRPETKHTCWVIAGCASSHAGAAGSSHAAVARVATAGVLALVRLVFAVRSHVLADVPPPGRRVATTCATTQIQQLFEQKSPL